MARADAGARLLCGMCAAESRLLPLSTVSAARGGSAARELRQTGRVGWRAPEGADDDGGGGVRQIVSAILVVCAVLVLAPLAMLLIGNIIAHSLDFVSRGAIHRHWLCCRNESTAERFAEYGIFGLMILGGVVAFTMCVVMMRELMFGQ